MTTKIETEDVLFLAQNASKDTFIDEKRAAIAEITVTPGSIRKNVHLEQSLDTNEDFDYNEVLFVTKKELKDFINKLQSFFGDLFNKMPEEQFKKTFPDSSEGGFVLDEIELNFNVETGVKFGLCAKADAGICLKFKRKK